MRRTWNGAASRFWLAAWVLGLSAGLAQPGLGQQPAPLDPLTPAERAAAIQIATSDARVRTLVGGRESDVAYAELYVTKPEGSSAGESPAQTPLIPRLAEVLISTFGGGSADGVRVIVDLRRRAVTQVERASDVPAVAAAAARVPFSPRELEMARTLALGEFRTRALAPADGPDWQVTYLPASPGDPDCPSRRCVVVLFYRGHEYLTTALVVDVATRGVRVRRGAQ